MWFLTCGSETDAEGDLDATIVEQLASAGIETGTLVQDISTGTRPLFDRQGSPVARPCLTGGFKIDELV
jgi:hypothetical protein